MEMIENDHQYAEALGEFRVLQRSPKGPAERERLEALTDLITDYESKRGLNIETVKQIAANGD